jgi:uncharacterized membrane protein
MQTQSITDPKMTPQAARSPSNPAAPAYSHRTLRALAIFGGIVLAVWLVGTPSGILGKADAIGYAICHRIAERSFFAHDHQLPLCARCTGIYLGVITGLLSFFGRGRSRAAKLPPVRLLLVMGGFVAFYGFDGINSYFSIFEFYTPVYQPHNTLRLLTGATFGLAMITVVWPIFNLVLWESTDPTPPIASFRDLIALYAMAGGVCILVLLNQPAILYAAALVSVSGVIVMFAIIGSVAFLTIARRENTLTRWRDLAIPALAGITFAITVIGMIDLARYLFTGTWEGFKLFS